MPQAGQIIPEHLYSHNMVVVNDNTEYTNTLPEAEDNSTHMLFVFYSPKGISDKIVDITNGLKEFVDSYGAGPASIYGQPYMNAYNAHRSGYITGHCLRVSALNSSYAATVVVALYRIDETGNMLVRFKKRTPENALTDLDEIDSLYTSPEETISDGSDDDGFTEVKLFTVASRWKGKCGRKLSFGFDTNIGGDKENNFKNYVMRVYENFSTLENPETYSVCMTEEAIVVDEALFIDGVVNHPINGSNRLQISTNLEGFQQIVDAYNDANPDSTFTVNDFDVLLGVDKYTRDNIYNYEIDSMSDDVVVMNMMGGISLDGGDDGDLDETTDPAIRQEALNAAYLRAFMGETDPMIASKNRFPCHIFLDANYPVETKQAMAALCERRTDTALVLDAGLDIKTLRSPITYVKNNLDSYVQHRNEEIMAICGKVRDPQSKKIVPVTVTYALAYRLPVHWAQSGGKHVPFAGNTLGIIDDDFIINSIYPVYDEDLHSDIMDELVEERINFARINAKHRTIISEQTTRQTITSNLSEMNNVMILLDIKRDFEELCASYHYNFSEAEDIVRFNKDAETITSDYAEAKVRRIYASFDRNDWEATRGILHLYVEMEHKDLVKKTIIEIDVNRGSSSATNE